MQGAAGGGKAEVPPSPYRVQALRLGHPAWSGSGRGMENAVRVDSGRTALSVFEQLRSLLWAHF
jgi:hypothetical protein